MARMRYELGKVSLQGNRSLNQDRCDVVESTESLILALADGMGGHPKGEVAAQILVDTSKALFCRARKPIQNPEQFLTQILQQAHAQVTRYGDLQSPPIKPRTTAVIALIQEDKLHWAYAGDSRLYLFRNGELHTRTKDHSYVEFLHQQGAITENSLEKHPYRNYVTCCLGGGSPPTDITVGQPTPLQPGDHLLLCSDGLWGPLSADQFSQAMGAEGAFNGRLEQLANQAAYIAAPESDNVTAIGLRWLQGSQPEQTTNSNMAHNPVPVPSDTATPPGEDPLTQAVEELKGLIDDFERKS